MIYFAKKIGSDSTVSPAHGSCTIEDGETFSLAKPFRSQRQALGPKGLFLKCVDIHASFTSKVKNVHYFFMTVDDRTDISVLWVQ